MVICRAIHGFYMGSAVGVVKDFLKCRMDAALDDNTDKNGRHMPTQNWLRHSEPPHTLWPNNFAFLTLSPSIMGQIEKKGCYPYFFPKELETSHTASRGLRVLLHQTVEGRSSHVRRIPAATSSGGFQKLGYLFGGPNNKGYDTLGSILGNVYLGKRLSPPANDEGLCVQLNDVALCSLKGMEPGRHSISNFDRFYTDSCRGPKDLSMLWSSIPSATIV